MRALVLVIAGVLVACGGSAKTHDGGVNVRGDAGTSIDDGSVVGGDGGTITPTGDGSLPPESCLGAHLLTSLGYNTMMVGGTMADATVTATPIDIRYIYLSGGLFDTPTACTSCTTNCTAQGHTCANSMGQGGCNWWGCQQYDMDPPGEVVRNLIADGKKASQPYVAMFSYYELLQTTNPMETSAVEVAQLNDTSVMTRYFADWRFLLQQIGKDVALLHVEPDLLGFAQQTNGNAHSIKAAVASANATDCSQIENSVAGFGQCLISMVRKYAPNAKVGLHASAWAAGIDALGNTDPKANIVGDAGNVAAFLIACGEADADFITIEASDRDAGYYQSQGMNTFWDITNATLPDFTQAFTWYGALTKALGKPAIAWQLPLGNASQTNVTDHWKDNRVDYLFGHTSDAAAAHIVGLAFGAGQPGQTTPESDGGNFTAKVKAYKAAGGQAVCQ